MPLTLSLLIINSLEVNIMSRKLTQEQFETKIFNLFRNKYSVISEYKGKREPITLHCNIHNVDFTVTAECFMRGTGDIRSSCPECTNDRKREKKILCTCSYCQKKFYRAPSKVNNSKSGLFFCCREHKDLAQRINSGEQFDNIRPPHYSTDKENGTINNYRDFAFRNYQHICSVCDWKEDENILQVHHIDENRQNNQLENLIILCPNCHVKLTSHRYRLIDRKYIILNNC